MGQDDADRDAIIRAKKLAHEILELECASEIDLEHLKSLCRLTRQQFGGIDPNDDQLVTQLAHNFIAAAAYSIGVCNEQ